MVTTKYRGLHPSWLEQICQTLWTSCTFPSPEGDSYWRPFSRPWQLNIGCWAAGMPCLPHSNTFLLGLILTQWTPAKPSCKHGISSCPKKVPSYPRLGCLKMGCTWYASLKWQRWIRKSMYLIFKQTQVVAEMVFETNYRGNSIIFWSETRVACGESKTETSNQKACSRLDCIFPIAVLVGWCWTELFCRAHQLHCLLQFQSLGLGSVQLLSPKTGTELEVKRNWVNFLHIICLYPSSYLVMLSLRYIFYVYI